jgi:hypothetical protein
MERRDASLHVGDVAETAAGSRKPPKETSGRGVGIRKELISAHTKTRE